MAARRFDGGTVRGLAALAAAGLLGVGLPARLALRAPLAVPDVIGAEDAAMARWRPALARPGARVPLVLAARPEELAAASERLLLASYALAPAVVVPVVVGDCLEGDAAACPLAEAGQALVCDGALGQAAWLALRHQLLDVDAAGRCVLLRRRAP